jgi:DNA-binding transcriptional LysR family regulator
MDLRHLQTFAAVADEGTYLAAARTLAVAQPALWRRVKDLEKEIGVALFERSGRRVRVTRDGRTLLAQARAVLAASDRFTREARDIAAGRAGTVAVACAFSHVRAKLAAVIGELRRRHPGIRVEIREYGGGVGPGRGIEQDLLEGLVDLAVGTLPGGDRRFEGVPLYDVHLRLPVPDDHPWRTRVRVDVQRLREVPLITARPGSFSRRVLEDACARAGFAPTIAFETPYPSSIIALGAAGLGVPVIVDDSEPPPAGRPWPSLGEGRRAIGATVSLGWRAAVPPSPAVRRFIEVAREVAA